MADDVQTTVRPTPPLARSSPGKVIQFQEREMPAHLAAKISHALKYGRDARYVPMDPPVPAKRD